jgi:hypothetical protein
MSQRNALEALRRHDWVHRWLQIFQIAGIEPAPGMIARVERLEDLAGAAATVATPSLGRLSSQRPAAVGVGRAG